VRILYTSEAVRRAVRTNFGAGSGRRVAVVAFVGAGAEAYLPNPKGLELYCWPSPSGTNAKAIRTLQRRGVSIHFVRRLHMKVYWSAKRGVIITSANLSTNAFGSGDLREIGVLLPSRSVDIEKVIRSLRAIPATADAIRDLEHDAREIERGRPTDGERPRTFPEWFDERPNGSEWRLMPYEGLVGASRALRAVAKQDRPDRKLVDWLNCSRGQVEGDEFLLTINCTSGSPRTPRWMFVHRIVRVKSDERAYERRFAYQAGQVYPLRSCPRPPFAIDVRFRRAMRLAPNALGPKWTNRYFVRGRPMPGLLKILRELYSASE